MVGCWKSCRRVPSFTAWKYHARLSGVGDRHALLRFCYRFSSIGPISWPPFSRHLRCWLLTAAAGICGDPRAVSLHAQAVAGAGRRLPAFPDFLQDRSPSTAFVRSVSSKTSSTALPWLQRTLLISFWHCFTCSLAWWSGRPRRRLHAGGCWSDNYRPPPDQWYIRPPNWNRPARSSAPWRQAAWGTASDFMS